jgi:hypothetical protein
MGGIMTPGKEIQKVRAGAAKAWREIGFLRARRNTKCISDNSETPRITRPSTATQEGHESAFIMVVTSFSGSFGIGRA